MSVDGSNDCFRPRLPLARRPHPRRAETADAPSARSGQRLFNLSYHSPSLLPGSTPYARDEAQLDQFLEMLEAYIVWFASELGGCFTTPLEVKALLEADQA
jgi:hypothetical protein